jgi:hypothetical protein
LRAIGDNLAELGVKLGGLVRGVDVAVGAYSRQALTTVAAYAVASKLPHRS